MTTADEQPTEQEAEESREFAHDFFTAGKTPIETEEPPVKAAGNYVPREGSSTSYPPESDEMAGRRFAREFFE